MPVQNKTRKRHKLTLVPAPSKRPPIAKQNAIEEIQVSAYSYANASAAQLIDA